MQTTKRRGRGEGGLEELPSGKWRAILSLGKRPNGKRRKLTYTVDTKKAALKWLRDRQAEHGNGQLAEAGKLTVGEWLDKWLDLRKPNIERLTYLGYEGRVKLHLKPRIGALPLGQLRPLHVEQLFADMATAGASASERAKAGGTLRTALKHAVRSGLIPRNPATEIPLPKVKRPEKTALDAGQAAKLLAAIRGHRLAALFDFWLDVGPRPGEVYALHWSDVDLEAGTVFIRRTVEDVRGKLRLKEPKTEKSRRRVRIATRTVSALRAHREVMRLEGRDVDKGIVFPAPAGGFLRNGYFDKRVLKPALKAAGLPTIRPYDLRHSSATLLLSQDVNVRVVSDRLGHDSIEITLKYYAHALPDMQERAVMAIDRLFGVDCPTSVPR